MHTGFSKGFTLVELIATLVIIALIAVVTGPMFFSVSTFRESGFYDETLAAVRYAQKHAVATNCTVRVNITANGFSLFQAANAGACSSGTYNTAVTDPSSNQAVFTRTAPDGVSLSTTPVTPNIVFSSDGRASAGVTVKVGSKPFTVIAETGFVQRQ
jgi:MSHA pilin protein MshC